MLIIILIVAIGLAGGFAYYALSSTRFSLKEPVTIYVDNQKNYDALLAQLQSEAQLKSPGLFNLLAKRIKYPENMKTGKYEIRSGMSYLEVIRMLRSGQQTPVQLTFNNIRLKTDLVERIGQQMMFSPDDLLDLLNDPIVAASFGLDTTTIITLFIPNTYEIYWNTSPDKFLERRTHPQSTSPAFKSGGSQYSCIHSGRRNRRPAGISHRSRTVSEPLEKRDVVASRPDRQICRRRRYFATDIIFPFTHRLAL